MKNFLSIHENRQAYNEAMSEFQYPHVAYISEDDELVFSQVKPEPETDWSKEYLTFLAIDDCTFANDVYMEYSLDGGETWEMLFGEGTPTVTAGNKIMFKATETGGESIKFSSTGRYEAMGNAYSMLFGDDFAEVSDLSDYGYVLKGAFQGDRNLISAKNLSLPATTLAEGCYESMFDGCTSLTTAPALPATELADGCYSGMFEGCTSLTTAPALPATELADGCYSGMFEGCTSLTEAPELPATTLDSYCYEDMFQGCTSLTAAPELPATELADRCYSGMFANTNLLPDVSSIDFTDTDTVQSCGLKGLFKGTKITDADLTRILPKNAQDKPCLPVTTLADYCYEDIFRDCTSLTTAPELPATTLAQSCYNNMFNGCTSLTTAPALPATTLASSCYSTMFQRCTSLTTAPALPATTLTNSCYYNMFSGCTSLATAPELPATTLALNCYNAMFYGCTSLTEAPVLPAPKLDNLCYMNMFYGCTSLNYIKMLATDVSATNCLKSWVNRVSATGTFVKHPNANLPSGTSGIPEGWTVETATA